MADVMDIMDIDRPSSPAGRTDSHQPVEVRRGRKKKNPDNVVTFKRPEGMHRELYALLYTDNKDGPPIIPTDVMPINNTAGYKQVKAKLGLRKVRPWKWMPFVNPARTDVAQLHHWRRVCDENREYPFAKFNKTIQIPTYTDAEYQQLLHLDGWTKQETDYLLELCRQFDLRFVIIADRWDRETFPQIRTIEDLKERYYHVHNTLAKLRSGGQPETVKFKGFDADHERRRKEQLVKLYDRTPEQVEEEQNLLNELRKIELRKKEREKKTQDLQKLITAADSSSSQKRSESAGPGPGRPGRGPGRKKMSHLHKAVSGSKAEGSGLTASAGNILENTGIKFPEIKASGTSLRSQKMKLPASVGQKKTKAIEQLLVELNVELRPMPTDGIAANFNELRSDMVLLYDLKMALSSCSFEIQTLKHQYEMLTGKQLNGQPLAASSPMDPTTPSTASVAEPPSAIKGISEVLDITTGPVTPNRKRRAALDQVNLMKKLKNKQP